MQKNDNKNNIILNTNKFYIYFDDFKYDNLIIRSYYIVQNNVITPIGSHFIDNIKGFYEQPIYNEKAFAIVIKNENDINIQIRSIFDFETMNFINKDEQNINQLYDSYFNISKSL